jgi:GNAT superfamily N-acetyltransferase
MSAQGFEIRPLNLRSATDHEYACLNEFKNILRSEVLPEDPLFPYSEDVQRWRTMPDFQKETAWAVWDEKGEKIIAFGEGYVWYTGDNEHLAQFSIEVLPEHRQQGLGRRILSHVVEFAHCHKRRLLVSGSNDRVPASGAFLARLGARQGLLDRTNQLRLSELDRSLIERWMLQSRSLLDTFDLGLWNNAYPEDHLVAIAHLIKELANDEPRDDLEMEDFNITPEFLRQLEQNIFAAGTKRWSIYITSRVGNHLVGLTEVFWNPNRPTILEQGFTGVLVAYRKKGLGRWLKAEMMTRILHERPEVEVIRTGNSNSNAPMLKINNSMGFKPFIARAVWQVDVEVVEKYLSATA